MRGRRSVAIELGTMKKIFYVVLPSVVLSIGCAVAPTQPGEPASVTEDLSQFLKREWPLNGPPVIPADAMPASMCACGQHGSCGEMSACDAANDSNCGGDECYQQDGYAYGANEPEQVWANDWDAPPEMQKPKVIRVSRPPAIPNGPGPPGRFFPVPVKPVFAPNSWDQEMVR